MYEKTTDDDYNDFFFGTTRRICIYTLYIDEHRHTPIYVYI